MSDNSLIIFKSISKFTKELGEMFSSEQRSLKLYCRLIDKTTISHEKAIEKHTEAFRRFCVTNRNSILSKDSSSLEVHKILYSHRVFINMNDIFSKADKETTEVIWKHLLCISALVDPSSNAKQILTKNMEEGKSSVRETEFLTNIISKVDKEIDTNTNNPMEAISSLLNSGIMTDIMSGMNGGQLDIGKLLGAVQNMSGNIPGAEGGENPMAGMMQMMTQMMGSLQTGGEGGEPPDFGKMMQGLVASMPPPPPTEKNSEQDCCPGHTECSEKSNEKPLETITEDKSSVDTLD